MGRLRSTAGRAKRSLKRGVRNVVAPAVAGDAKKATKAAREAAASADLAESALAEVRRIAGALPGGAVAAAARPTTAKVSGRKPVVGLAGFFGDGNYGDELFLEVFKQHLGPHFELKVLADLPSSPYFSRDVKDVVADVDAIVIGGGDILQPWNQDPRYFNHAFLAKPVFVVGIGVPQYTGPNAPEEKEHIVARHRRFMAHPNVRRIGVRDDQAALWIRERLDPPGEILVAPDIVSSLDLPPATKPEGPPILGVVTRFRPNRAKPDDYSEVVKLAQHVSEQGWRVRQIILGTNNVGQRDLANAEDFVFEGKEVVYSEDLDDLSRAIGECTTLASMKFHGTVVATMYGVPSIVMIPTNKNINFMHRIGLDALVSSFDSPKLIEKFEGRPEVGAADLARIRRQATEHMRGLANAIAEAVVAR